MNLNSSMSGLLTGKKGEDFVSYVSHIGKEGFFH